MIKYYVILLFMTFIGSIASYFLKKSSNNKFKDLIKNKYLYVGGLLYIIGALINIYLLKYLNYSIVLPLNSLTYVWTLIISNKFLNENITKKKIIGIVSIIIGAFLIAI